MMMKQMQVAFEVLLFTVNITPFVTSISCPTDFVGLGDSCYNFSDHVELNWDVAFQKCQQLDSRAGLATIRSIAEWEFIRDYLTKNNMDTMNWWLGGSDRIKEGHWVWVQIDEPICCFNWCRHEPNGGAYENCIHTEFKSMCWNDVPCENPGTWFQTNFICEVEPM